MKAFVFDKPGIFGLRDVKEPEPKADDDVVIQVEAVGLCGTDTHIVSLPQRHPAANGIILGHEVVGRVVHANTAATGIHPGARIVAGPNIPCEQCHTCRRGLRSLCEQPRTLGITCDGGLASYMMAPARVLFEVPDGLSAEQALFAEPLSCVINGLYAIGPCYGSRAVVLGAGPIGLYFIRLLKRFGASIVIASEPLAVRRAAAIASGASLVCEPDDGCERARIRDACQGDVDIVIDTTGFLLTKAVDLVRRGGDVLVFGLDATCECTLRPFEIVRYAKRITGCFVNNEMIPKCLELILELGLGELITSRFHLAEIAVAMEVTRASTSIKTVIFPTCE